MAIWMKLPGTIDNSGSQTHEVAQKRANGFGLYDMLGNVWEWVNDWYDQNYYQNSPSQDPRGQRAGSCAFCGAGPGATVPGTFACRTATARSGHGHDDVGFRCGGEVFAP